MSALSVIVHYSPGSPFSSGTKINHRSPEMLVCIMVMVWRECHGRWFKVKQDGVSVYKNDVWQLSPISSTW